jgi:beta-glucosidase
MKRVHLEPREKRMITFKLSAAQMSIIDDNGKRVVEPGQFVLTVGGSQPGVTSNGVVTGRFQTTGKRIVIE